MTNEPTSTKRPKGHRVVANAIAAPEAWRPSSKGLVLYRKAAKIRLVAVASAPIAIVLGMGEPNFFLVPALFVVTALAMIAGLWGFANQPPTSNGIGAARWAARAIGASALVEVASLVVLVEGLLSGPSGCFHQHSLPTTPTLVVLFVVWVTLNAVVALAVTSSLRSVLGELGSNLMTTARWLPALIVLAGSSIASFTLLPVGPTTAPTFAASLIFYALAIPIYLRQISRASRHIAEVANAHDVSGDDLNPTASSSR